MEKIGLIEFEPVIAFIFSMFIAFDAGLNHNDKRVVPEPITGCMPFVSQRGKFYTFISFLLLVYVFGENMDLTKESNNIVLYNSFLPIIILVFFSGYYKATENGRMHFNCNLFSAIFILFAMNVYYRICCRDIV